MDRIATLTIDSTNKKAPEGVMADRLKKARGLSGLSAQKLGEDIGKYFGINPIARGTIYTWEKTGNVPGMYLNAIAESLGVEFEFFAL